MTCGFLHDRRVAVLAVTAMVVVAAVAWHAAAQEAGQVAAGDPPKRQASQADWPRWRGPQGNGISTETGWLAKWPEGGPKVLWKRRVGAGFSSVSVSNNRVYTMGGAKNVDTVWCLDAATGKPIWQQSYDCRDGSHAGTRCTPTVDGKLVYTLSRRGHVHCFDAATGKPAWSKDLGKELGIRPPTWGFAGSPLVAGELLIVNVGSAGVALNKATGEVVWQTGKGKAGYASPVPFNIGQRRCVLIFAGEGLACVDLKDGKRLWLLPWRTSYDVNAADPIVFGDKIFISSGYNRGCALIQVKDGKPEVLWQNRKMRNHFSACVLYKGHLYGADGNTNPGTMSGQAVLRCIDPQTKEVEVKWSSGRLYMASLMVADGKLIIQGDGGVLIVAEATPEGFKQISRANVLTGKCWTMPVLAGGRIYCRNHQPGEVVCVDVRAE